MIRLIACDIDGTLLHGSETKAAPVVFQEIRRLHQRGILFCPASGRQYDSMRRLFPSDADRLPYVCENGAIVYGPGNPGPVLSKTVMDRTLALKLSGEILATPECELMVSGANTSYLCPKKPYFVAHIRDFVGNNVSIISSPSDIPEDIVKVSSYCRQGARLVEPILSPGWSRHFNVAVAGEKWLDFTLADKGTGLRQLCAALGIGLNEVVAIGDNYNDLPMLDIVGNPYIMDNAVPDLRRCFPRHCRRVEDVLRSL